jgi:nucleotidyltransferase/DNA polymerase involved in DNA repair
MERSIFHIRLKNFEIQAERLVDKQLSTKPVAIISSSSHNGTVVQLSEEAREEGIKEGMKVSLVRKMTHSVKLLNYNDRLYNTINTDVFKTVCSFSPLVEPSCYGQYYVDMSGMHAIYKSNRQAGSIMLKTLTQKADIAGLLGIGSNKLVSRICTLTVPEPVHEVHYGSEARFVAPLSTRVLPAAREKEVARIVDFLMLRQVYEIQGIMEQRQPALVLFGAFHHTLEMQANGQDHSVVCPPLGKPHILKQKILNSSTNDADVLAAAVQCLAAELGFDLRMANKLAQNLLLEVHYEDGFTGSATGRPLSNDEPQLNGLCVMLLQKANYRRNRIRSVLLDATDLRPANRQLNLFAEGENKNLKISVALDTIRKRFGAMSIQPAAALML